MTMRALADYSVAFNQDYDERVRAAAFEWLAGKVVIHGDVLSRDVLAAGFELDQRRVPLVGPQGIFKPAVMEVPLSIATAPHGPYDDEIGYDSLLRYRYRGTDPQHHDNVGLRFAMQKNLPLAYFYGVVPGKYMAMWPVYVVRDQPEYLVFSVAVDDADQLGLFSQSHQTTGAIAEIRREYITTTAVRRLHQSAFRERVLRAYRHQCAFCRLRHGELLDAAHIIPDAEPGGKPIVSNGLSLCRLHHATFDRFFVGVRPDGTIDVRADILEEFDGPTLQHAIQGLHDQRIALPRKPAERPSAELLAKRYDRFLEVAATI